MKESKHTTWTKAKAVEYYGINRWGRSQFSISKDGHLCVDPLSDGQRIDLFEVVREATAIGLQPPLTIRLQDMLHQRVFQLNQAFEKAIEDERYKGRYRGVFPIKVNQLKEVVEEILDAGKPFQFGLEAGSKPELLIAMAMLDSNEPLLLCNGYKDEEYIRLALMGRRLGRQVILVIEQLSEVDTILRLTKKLNVEPMIGIRLKLNSQGEGKWATSAGDNAKFGLSTMEVVSTCKKLKKAGLTDALQLIHFHIGSQVPNILPIKQAVTEATRFYCEISKLGFPLKYLDVGGGLGIDYDGSKSNFESSMNYSMEVYARDVVFNIKSVCESASIPPPDIVSESGRAIVAPHSILITEVVDRIAKVETSPKPPRRKHRHQSITDLLYILNSKERYGGLERFHDAQQKKEEIQSLFSLGFLDLESRAEAESLYWQICKDIQQSCLNQGYIPEELAELNGLLAEQYVCNFSVFQSLLDHWALKQLFPIMPIHRLDEEPTVATTLVDITCDSDGKISEYIDLEDVRHSLLLHEFKRSAPYYLGIFLVGAYQDILGDLHNLFGRVNEVHVYVDRDEENGFYIEESISGFSTDEVLNFIQYKGTELSRRMKQQIDQATKNNQLRAREGVRLLSEYTELLKAKTYLTPKARPRKRKPAT